MATDISRRLFLRSTAAASAALATVSAPIVAEASQQEHPTLLRIRDELPAAVREWQEAEQQRQASRARFAEIAPQVPDQLIVRNSPARLNDYLSEREVDCEFKPVWPEPSEGKAYSVPRMIYSSDAIERSCYPFKHQPASSKEGKHWRSIHRQAKAYEEALEEARQNSGILDAVTRLYNAEDRLRRIVNEAAEIVPHSLTGLVIKAQAMMAYSACGGRDPACIGYARNMPSDILALFALEQGAAVT